ncbi:glycosyltransferase [Clostridium thermopalmarium]|uniref:D-inositol 3-phosphate glycosyltransferase n=1 Tax=Clostridium thermopalmarium DSM 5974 TaxID=1121340 RepID=A0A2T0AXC0_9CLOT|nr:glycosyltransferase [Clostridium thermopalmarium]PRR75453.1 D-inositol 3-phosphate glycosyltransferase [Clostridium thermopalmarium DSM 5974]PVZ24355.1 glycosyltransferase involved in cell wall biosynthesis [Clostridium thermopalmarium DSM 5974]
MTRICILGDADSIHTKKWIDYFSELNYEIHLISLRDTKYKYANNVSLYVLNPPFSSKLSYFLLIPKVKKLVKKINPDILHSFYASSYGMLGMACRHKSYIVSAWGSDIYEFPKSNIFNKVLLEKILKSARVVCSTSKDMAREIEKYYEGEIILTPFGVDIEKFKCTTPILANNYITIGITKGLEKIYGINYLIEAFSELSKEWIKDNIRLLIVGDGSEKENLKLLCKDKGIESKVTFTGRVRNEEIPHYLNQMDIVCFPSLSESFGVAAVEAGSCKRPVLASNVGGLKEVIIEGYNGYLVEKENSKMIKEKLKFMLSNKNNLLVLGENARKHVEENYNWKNNAKIMIEVYSRYI